MNVQKSLAECAWLVQKMLSKSSLHSVEYASSNSWCVLTSSEDCAGLKAWSSSLRTCPSRSWIMSDSRLRIESLSTRSMCVEQSCGQFEMSTSARRCKNMYKYMRLSS